MSLKPGTGWGKSASQIFVEAAKASDGQLGTTHEQLLGLPGVGPNTAGAILAYAYNQPAILLKPMCGPSTSTGFKDQTDVPDSAIRALVETDGRPTKPAKFLGTDGLGVQNSSGRKAIITSPNTIQNSQNLKVAASNSRPGSKTTSRRSAAC